MKAALEALIGECEQRIDELERIGPSEDSAEVTACEWFVKSLRAVLRQTDRTDQLNERRSPEVSGPMNGSSGGGSWETAGTPLAPQQGRVHARGEVGSQYSEVDADSPFSAHHVKPHAGSIPADAHPLSSGQTDLAHHENQTQRDRDTSDAASHSYGAAGGTDRAESGEQRSGDGAAVLYTDEDIDAGIGAIYASGLSNEQAKALAQLVRTMIYGSREERRGQTDRAQDAKPKCVMGEYCHLHGFVHGAEAEELRSRIERLCEQGEKDALGRGKAGRVFTSELRDLLDNVDARDSVTFVLVDGERQLRGTAYLLQGHGVARD